MAGSDADAAGDVELLGGEVDHSRRTACRSCSSACSARQVGDRAAHIHRADGVADDLVLLAHGPVALVVLPAVQRPWSGRQVGSAEAEVAGYAAALVLQVEVVRLLPAVVEKSTGRAEVAMLAGDSVELDQCELDLLVAVISAGARSVGTEDGVDQVRVTADDVEQVGLAGRFVVGDTGFDEVPGAVQLVRVAQVGEPLARLDHGEVDVEVAVVLLGAGEQVNRLVDGTSQVRVVLAWPGCSWPPRSTSRRRSPRRCAARAARPGAK